MVLLWSREDNGQNCIPALKWDIIISEPTIRYEHGSVTSCPFWKLRQTDRQNDQQADWRVHREVTLLISEENKQYNFAFRKQNFQQFSEAKWFRERDLHCAFEKIGLEPGRHLQTSQKIRYNKALGNHMYNIHYSYFCTLLIIHTNLLYILHFNLSVIAF